jgi:hypothetical protein
MSNDIGKPFVLEYEAKSGEFAYYLKEGISEFRAKQ